MDFTSRRKALESLVKKLTNTMPAHPVIKGLSGTAFDDEGFKEENFEALQVGTDTIYALMRKALSEQGVDTGETIYCVVATAFALSADSDRERIIGYAREIGKPGGVPDMSKYLEPRAAGMRLSNLVEERTTELNLVADPKQRIEAHLDRIGV
jgi:hypothetical protein